MKQGRSIRLRQERERRGWSRAYVAEQIGVDLGTVGRWERGERFPHPHYRQKLCALFEKSAQELGLLSEVLNDDVRVDLDPHSQISLTNKRDATQALVTKQSISTSQQIDLPPLESLSIENEPSTSKALTLMSLQNRQHMLRKMHSFWINGVLEQSLHGASFITLSLIEQDDAVTDPWMLKLQRSGIAPRPLNTNMPIGEIYDESDGELLILGEPGSGKTTLLLELTRILLERASREELHQIPVVFNLASWAIKRRSLSEWMEEELCTKYQVPHKLAQVWVQTEQILPLLDGLDEVIATARSACIETINAYRQEHGLLSMVVSCRQSYYFTQDARLLLRRGVVVQPLTTEQIEAYLISGGEPFAALRHALQADSTLQELASRPLTLSILAQTYQDKAIDVHSASLSLEARRREVFATYIRRMLSHQKRPGHYTAKQTQYWLTWLAKQLVEQQQTEFYIERMQPCWLSSPQAFRWYCRLLVGLLMGLLGGITAMLADVPLYELVHMRLFVLFSQSGITASQCADTLPAFGTVAETIASLISTPIVGLIYGIGFGLLGGLFACREPRFRFVDEHTRLSKFYRHGFACLLGLGCGSIFVLINLLWVPCPLSTGSYNQVAEELSYGLAGVLAGGLLGMLTGELFGVRKARIQPVEALIWTRASGSRYVISSLLGCIFGILVGGGTELASEVYIRFSSWQNYFLISVLIGGLLGLAIGGSIGGFSRHTLEKSSLVRPNEGIHRSMRNGLVIGIPIGLTLSSFTLGLAWWLVPSHFSDGLLWCLPLGLIVTTNLVLLNGGYAWLQHVILRLILYCQGYIPWNYARFLDEAADRLLLRKVGGGYIFIHRLLLDYFASI